MSRFEESSRIDEGRSNESIAADQAPDNPSILSKRSLSEIETMDVYENILYKKIKTYSQDDQVLEVIISEDSKKMVLFSKKSV